MIDLHSHILPGIDDGAQDLETSLEMARIAVADGIKIMACTPHVRAPVFDNTSATIRQAVNELQRALDANGISLKLVVGADIHLTADLLQLLEDGDAPKIGDSKYFLLEPSHHIMPPHIDKFCSRILEHGYVPVLTHPERLTWIKNHYDMICRLDALGLVIQLTAASITGHFGKTAKYWSERMLAEGRVDIIASDSHDANRRPPVLSKARTVIEEQFGGDMAIRLIYENPKAIVENRAVVPRKRIYAHESSSRKGIFDKLLSR